MKINEKVLRRIIRREILKENEENESFLSKLDNIKKSFKDKAFQALFDKMIPDGDTTASSKFRTWVRKNKTTEEIKKALAAKGTGIEDDFTLSSKVSSKKYAKNKHVKAAFKAFGLEYVQSLSSSKIKSFLAGKIDPGDIKIDFKKIDSSKAVNRAEEISEALGIDPAFVYAVEKKESAFKPRVMAWNVHIMRNPEFYKDPSQVITDEQQKELTRLGFPRKKSYYGNNAIKAFRKAFKVNPYGAIIAGAWGHYQVLGSFAITAYDNSPAKWMKAFNDDPEKYAIESFKTWVNEYGKKFIDAANRGDYDYTTKKYFGSSTSAMGKEYKSLIASYVKEYRRKHGGGWQPSSANT